MNSSQDTPQPAEGEEDIFEFEQQEDSEQDVRVHKAIDALTNPSLADEHHDKLLSEYHELQLSRTNTDYRTEFVKRADDEDQLDEEDIYDKFVPTNAAEIAEYNQQKEAASSGGQGNLDDYIITEPVGADGETRIRIDRPVGVYTPPENFSPVCGSIYRSAFPRIENFDFLATLKLKAVLCLIPEEYPKENIEFNANHGIKFFQVGLSGNKEPFVKIKPELVTEALKIMVDPANQPILIHCNRGKHRTGCIVGCVRKLQKWSLSMIFDEYRKFAYPKERPLDQQFIEMYDDSEVFRYLGKRGWSLGWS